MKYLFFWIGLFLFFQQGTSWVNAQEIPAFFRVHDLTQTLSQEEKNILEQKIKHYEDSTSTQIAVLIIPSVGGKKIENFAAEVAQKLRIGKRNKNNGVLILIAKEDKKIRIEVGYGLEGALPDLETQRIIKNLMFPSIKQGNFYEALDKAIDRITVLAASEFSTENQPLPSFRLTFMLVLLGLGVLLILLGIYFFMKKSPRNG